MNVSMVCEHVLINFEILALVAKKLEPSHANAKQVISRCRLIANHVLLKLNTFAACRYAKSDWSVCENGLKTKTLTLSEGDGDCEVNKTISKQCSAEETKQRSKPVNKQRARKKTQTSTDA